jgi:hypothetical protein
MTTICMTAHIAFGERPIELQLLPGPASSWGVIMAAASVGYIVTRRRRRLYAGLRGANDTATTAAMVAAARIVGTDSAGAGGSGDGHLRGAAAAHVTADVRSRNAVGCRILFALALFFSINPANRQIFIDPLRHRHPGESEASASALRTILSFPSHRYFFCLWTGSFC